MNEKNWLANKNKPKLSIVVNRHGNVIINFGDVLVDRVNIGDMDNFEEKVRRIRSAITGAGFRYTETVNRSVHEKLGG